MIVRFATTCDTAGCRHRSIEYSVWPSCRVCLLDICPQHARPGSLVENDGRETVVCVDCDPDDE